MNELDHRTTEAPDQRSGHRSGESAAPDQSTRRAPHMERFVEVRPVIMKGYPDAQHVFLKVGNQSFCVSKWGCETLEEAVWMRDMLCIALDNIVKASSVSGDRSQADAISEGSVNP